MSNYTLHHGDCLDVMRSFESASIDLTVTSPPYDNLRDYGADFNGLDWQPIIKELYRVTAVGGVVVWVVADATIKGSETGTSFRQALWAMECGFKLHDTMIYVSERQPLNGPRYEPKFEYMFVWHKPGKKITFNPIRPISKHAGKTYSATNRLPSGEIKLSTGRKNGKCTHATKVKGNVWKFGTGHGNGNKLSFNHPAVFPYQLAHDHIISWSNPHDTILDPFMGSGTTGIACINTGRNFIGIELDKEYFKLSETRIKNTNGEFVRTKDEIKSGQLSIF